MTKKEFIDRHEISDAVPLDPSRKTLPAEAFASALEEFLEGRFYGAIKVRLDMISAQSILICAEYAAYFFKTLLTDIYGRAFLYVNIESDDKGLNILISADDALPLSESEMRRLIRIARNAGFDIRPEPCSIKLSVAFSHAAIRRVYAVSVVDGRRIMLGKLIEIFYQGEPMPAEPKPRQRMREPVTKNKK